LPTFELRVFNPRMFEPLNLQPVFRSGGSAFLA
jgi:hypothetical protein